MTQPAPSTADSTKSHSSVSWRGYQALVSSTALVACLACGETSTENPDMTNPAATGEGTGVTGTTPPPSGLVVGTPTPSGTAPAAGGTTPMPASTAMPEVPVIQPPVAGQCLSSMDEDGNWVLLAKEANNYSFSSTIEVATTTVAANSELFFDWSALTTDFMGHGLDPMTNIDMLSLIIWKLNHAEMQEKLNSDQLGASDTLGGSVIALYTEKARTDGSIFDFNIPGSGPRPADEPEDAKLEFQNQVLGRLNPAEIDPATHTYTIMAQEGYVLGEGVRMVQAFTLSETETNTQVAITPASSTLTYDADLTSLTPVMMPAGVSNILVNWEEIETNALGREFEDRSIEEVMVAKYSLTPEQLQGEFLDLEYVYDEMYRGPVVAGEELVLSDLSDENGMPFTGISADGTWIVALVCGYCGNPAPWYITVVQACQ